MRCFIAIELEKKLVNRLDKLQQRLIKEPHMNDRAVRWVRPSDIHLTLNFLGDVEDRAITELCRTVDTAVENIQPFEFEMAEYGCFPATGAARVLWAGVEDPTGRLVELQKTIENAIAPLEFRPENRKFRPHLTLARVKQSELGRNIAEQLQKSTNLPFQPARQAVSQVTVFQSSLTRNGPIYTAIHHSTLGTA